MGMKEDLARKRAERATASQPATNGRITEDELRAHGIIETPTPEPIISHQEPKPELRPWKGVAYLPETTRALPQSLDAEKGVLGSILISAQRGPALARKIMFMVESKIGQSHFHLPAHQTIFNSIKALHSDNEPLDLITLTNALENDGLLDQVGGPALVTDLFTFTPTDANLDSYIEILQEKHALRQVIDLTDKLKGEAFIPGADIRNVIQAAKEKIEKISLTTGGIEQGIEVHSFDHLMEFDSTNDDDSVLGHRWLCRGGSSLWVGQSGIGKSSLAMQAGMMWAQARSLFGVSPTRRKRLKSLYIQAENDSGDMAEMMQGVLKAYPIPDGMTREDFAAEMRKSMFFVRDTIHTSTDFARSAAKLIHKYTPDLVWVDPLLSYAGDDISSQKVASQFLRNTLNPIAFDTGICWMLLHHTGKPSTDPKAKAHWTDHDFSYAAFGSSELVNWARAVNVLRSMGDGKFELRFSKRGKRSGLREFNPFQGDETEHVPAFTDVVYLKHAEHAIFWEQIAQPEEAQKQDAKRKNSGQFETKYSQDDILEILRKAVTPRTPTELYNLAREQTGISRQFWTIWKQLKEAHLVIENNRRWTPTNP
ncbi:MAG: DnaB-like helicase N-terminal domain-containing protein [Verrucomicrobiae bacterium]